VTTPDYQEYMQKKHHWIPTYCKVVNWIMIKYTICNIQWQDKQFMCKSPHDLPPLLGLSHQQQTATNTQCHWDTKMFWHFLECQHPHQTTLFSKHHHDLHRLHQSEHLGPHLFQLLRQGLNSIHQQSPFDDQLESYPPIPSPLPSTKMH